MEDENDYSQMPDIHDLPKLGANPALDRRLKVIARLEEQKLLLDFRHTDCTVRGLGEGPDAELQAAVRTGFLLDGKILSEIRPRGLQPRFKAARRLVPSESMGNGHD